MSTSIMARCWPLQMPPTPKAVLISLADNANDHGHCWPSLTKIAERTCFGRTAVINAIKWLEEHEALKADRSDRYKTAYVVTPEGYREADKSAKRTSSHGGELVHLADNEVRETDDEVREADTNRQEPPRTVSKATVKARAEVALPDWLPPESWADWCQYRRGKTWTPKAQELSLRSLTKLRDQGHDPVTVIENAIDKGWRGLYPPGKQREKTNANSSGMSAADRIAAKIREQGVVDDGFLGS